MFGQPGTLNRRGQVRLAVSIPAIVATEELRLPVVLRNVSGAGLRLLSERDIPVGSEVEVWLFPLLPAAEVAISLPVIWTCPVGSMWRVGLSPAIGSKGWLPTLLALLSPALPTFERRQYRRLVCRFAVSLVNQRTGVRLSAICTSLSREGCQVYLRRPGQLSGSDWTIRLGPGKGWGGLAIAVVLGGKTCPRAFCWAVLGNGRHPEG